MSNVGIVHHSGSVLAMHVKSKQEKIKYTCDQCSYQAAHKTILASHIIYIYIKSAHQDFKYPCDRCPYKARHKGSLQKKKTRKVEIFQLRGGGKIF